MSKIIYIKGDVTEPIGTGLKVIGQCVNNMGYYGAGVSGAIEQKFHGTMQQYREYCKNRTPEELLGQVQLVFFSENEDIVIANLFAQNNIYPKDSKPIQYNSLRKALKYLNDSIIAPSLVSLHIPKIGAGLAQGDWEIISKIIEEEIDVPVYCYEI